MLERFDKFFKSDNDKLAEADRVLSLLSDSPAFRERQRELEEKRLETLRGLLAKREQTERQQAELLPGLNDAVAEAERKEKAAVEALQAARRQRIAAEQASRAAAEFTLKLSQIDGEIRKAAPREIDEFIREMLEADEKARLEVRTELRPGRKSFITGQATTRIVDSNLAAVNRKREYLRKAIAEAEAMKSQAVPLEEIAARLEKLKAGIPAAHVFELVNVPLPNTQELRGGVSI